MINDLNEETFLLYAMKSYDKPNCIQSEFEEDLQRIKYIKRLFKRYRTSGELKERLIMNHIIILSNVFGVHPTVRILFYKLDPGDYIILKTFLLYLNYMPDIVTGINGTDINSKDLTVDLMAGKRLSLI
jgi:hypothetical protein